MELHHGDACWEPLCEDPEAICPSDPALVPILAKEMLELLNNLDSRLGPYLAHGNIGDIGGVAYYRITAEILRALGDALEILAPKWEALESMERSRRRKVRTRHHRPPESR
jgi:hypothetical protein